MDAQYLLQQASHVLQKEHIKKMQTGYYYNIFRVTNMYDDEVKICRVLHDLLNPAGQHYQGTLFLKVFVEKVLHLKFTDYDYTHAKVAREYATQYGRRIDLFIQTPNIHVPIEVKIHAHDQLNQCNDYFDYAKESPLFYLTKYGTPPSDESVGKLNEDDIHCISFQKHIIAWLQYCLMLPQITAAPSIQVMLTQLIDAIKAFTNQLGDDVMDEMKSVISANSETLQSALVIQKALVESKIALMQKIFRTLEQRIGGKPVASTYEKGAIDYYNKRPKIQALRYVVKENAIDGKDILFSIEIDHRLYAGFHVEGTSLDDCDETLLAHVPQMKEICENRTLLNWQYLPLTTYNELPTINFHEADMHDDYIKLFDDHYFEKFIDDCIESIYTLFPKLKGL